MANVFTQTFEFLPEQSFNDSRQRIFDDAGMRDSRVLKKIDKKCQTYSLGVAIKPDHLETGDNTQELLGDLRESIGQLNARLGDISHLHGPEKPLSDMDDSMWGSIHHRNLPENLIAIDGVTMKRESPPMENVRGDFVDEYLKNVDHKKLKLIQKQLRETMHMLHEANSKEIYLKKENMLLKSRIDMDESVSSRLAKNDKYKAPPKRE